MTPLLRTLRRVATCAGLAAIGWSARSQAQIPEPIVGGEIPKPIGGGEIRRAVPAAPIVQQSPNGLFGLSITDAGIELRGPKGGLKITNAGIEIGDLNSRVTIRATDMELRGSGNIHLRGDGTVTLKVAGTLELQGGGGANFVRITQNGVELTAYSGSVKLTPAGVAVIGTKVELGCPGGKPAARVGDVVNTTVTPAVIVQGSPKVLVC